MAHIYLYNKKTGNKVGCDIDQVPAMEKAGYTKQAPSVEQQKKFDAVLKKIDDAKVVVAAGSVDGAGPEAIKAAKEAAKFLAQTDASNAMKDSDLD